MSGRLGRPIVSVVYAELTAPVVRAQSVQILAALRDCGEAVDAVAFTSPRRFILPSEHSAHAEASLAFRRAIGRSPALLTHRPRLRQFAGTGARLANLLRDRGLGDAVLLCRQPRAALVGIGAREALADEGNGSVLVVHDLRGIRPEEYLLSLGKDESELAADEQSMLHAYREQEESACREADAVICVSEAMSRRVRSQYDVPTERTLRLPNHALPVADAEALRVTTRARLGIAPDALVLAYAGTLAAWQLPEASALLASAIRKERPDARLLMITPDQDAARAAIRAVGLKGALVVASSPEQTSDLLAAADYGLLLRSESVVNRVACPVKFGEYLAVGARPVLTASVGDQSALCSTTGLGLVVGLDDAARTAQAVLRDTEVPGMTDATGRARRRAWVDEHIAPNVAAGRLVAFLSGL